MNVEIRSVLVRSGGRRRAESRDSGSVSRVVECQGESVYRG